MNEMILRARKKYGSARSMERVTVCQEASRLLPPVVGRSLTHTMANQKRVGS
jgi:hypothetical protein